MIDIDLHFRRFKLELIGLLDKFHMDAAIGLPSDLIANHVVDGSFPNLKELADRIKALKSY